MIGRLFGKRRPADVEPAVRTAVPMATRVYAIGDIHGRADLVARLHESIRRDSADLPAACRKVVVYIGDYIDRGIESRQVIDLLLDEPLEGFESVHLLGNHEKAMMDFLDDIAIGLDWMSFGGDATLFSYGVGMGKAGNAEARLAQIQADLRERLPKRHAEFLASLRLMHTEGDYCFVHAGIRPGVALDRQTVNDLLWIREEFLHSPAAHGKIVVHGHSITPSPQVRPNRIGIDTGAFATGRLTCLVLEGDTRRFLQTGE